MKTQHENKTDLYHGYTEKELRNAFVRVQDRDDWKGPIYSVINKSDRDMIKWAIIFYTATVPRFSPCGLAKDLLEVHSEGYHLGSAGDH